jgi:hypothetical protein
LGKVAEVHGFSKSLQAIQDVPIVKAAVAYYDANTGETYILIINQALYFGDQLPNMLLNQNQTRSHGLIVDDCPRHLSGGKSSHSITVENLNIPLKLFGIMSYFDIRTPTIKELEECPHFELTSSANWEPYSLKLMEDESQMNDINVSSQSININYDDFHDKIMQNIAATKVTKTQLFVKSEDLAKKWIVGHRVAEDTVKVTTQSLIRNVIHPIERRFRTKAATLRYDQLKCRFYSDTFFSKEKSLLGNSCGQ